MPSYILKFDQETDEYAYWSTVVDNVLAVGSREQLTNYYGEELESEERWTRANWYGTSEIGGWWDDGLMVCNLLDPNTGQRWLNRENLREFCYATLDGDAEGQLALTEELDDR